MASAGPHASLHLSPDRQPCQHPTTQFFTGRMPFLPPNQQRQSTEGNIHNIHYQEIINDRSLYQYYSTVCPKISSHQSQCILHRPLTRCDQRAVTPEDARNIHSGRSIKASKCSQFDMAECRRQNVKSQQYCQSGL